MTVNVRHVEVSEVEDNLDHLWLEDGGFWYVATPFTSFPGSRQEATLAAAVVTRTLLNYDIGAFSPIAHSYPLHTVGGDGTYSFWLRVNEPILRAASGLLVVRLPGWEMSLGMSYERARFMMDGRPVLHIDPTTYNIVAEE